MKHRTFESILDRINAIEEAKDIDFFARMAKIYGARELEELL